MIKDKKEINDQLFAVDIGAKIQQTQLRKSDIDANEMKPIVVNNLHCTLKFHHEEGEALTFDIQSLLQLKLQPVGLVDHLSGYSYKFLCLTLRPIYLQQSKNTNRSTTQSHSIMESNFYSSFKGASILVTTQQDGYLYHIYSEKSNNGKCFAYPFTSPVRDVALDDTTLHALTDNGIESYTVRTGHKLFNEVSHTTIVPNINKSICLIGLRPFLGVRRMLLSDTNLVLLAISIRSPPSDGSTKKDDQGLWTIYNLQLPTANMIYKDFEELAKKKYSKNRNAFIDLIEEAHVMLRTNLEVSKLTFGSDQEVGLGTIAVLKENDSKELAEMYKDSCILLGDLYSL